MECPHCGKEIKKEIKKEKVDRNPDPSQPVMCWRGPFWRGDVVILDDSKPA